MRQRLSTMRNGRTGDWKNRPSGRSPSRVIKCDELYTARTKLGVEVLSVEPGFSDGLSEINPF